MNVRFSYFLFSEVRSSEFSRWHPNGGRSLARIVSTSCINHACASSNSICVHYNRLAHDTIAPLGRVSSGGQPELQRFVVNLRRGNYLFSSHDLSQLFFRTGSPAVTVLECWDERPSFCYLLDWPAPGEYRASLQQTRGVLLYADTCRACTWYLFRQGRDRRAPRRQSCRPYVSGGSKTTLIIH